MKLKEKWNSFSGKKRRVLSVIGCILLLICILELFVWLKIARLSFDKPEPAENIINVETAKEPTPHSRNIVNILVLGTDLPLPGTGDLGRCDSTTLLSLNLLTGKMKAISFERGINVFVKTVGRYDLLTHAYSYEGALGMVSAIENSFGVDIDGYIQVNFDTFAQIVDAIGGVDIDLTDVEVTALNNEGYIYSGVTTQAYVTPGRNHLNGHDTLEYARLRSVDDNFGRQQRQRTVIQAMINQIRRLPLFRLNHAANKILPLVHTNLPKFTLSRIFLHAPFFVGTKLQQMQVPEKEGSASYTMSVFSFQRETERIAEFLR